MIVHVIPNNDIRPHANEGTECDCDPAIEIVEGGILVTHNSYDGREAAEWANEILNTDPNGSCYQQPDR